MGKTHFLFLFSKRPDSYVNAMAHAFDKMDVSAVKFIYVEGIATGLSQKEASDVSKDIWNRLSSLAQVADVYKRIYERLLDRETKAIDYDSIRRQLSALVKKAGGPRHCIVDLTGAAKGPSIDIFSLCLALGIKSVYLFELTDPFDRANPDDSLYHNLGDSGYRYTCLSITAPVKASQSLMLRKTPMLWAISLAALVVIIITVTLGATAGPNSLPLQWLNVAASVAGLSTPLAALIQNRHS